ncbi:MAG: uncharacterized membrane protein YcgQ (UPF0703/DUF1980 family) [Verrucomicrobiales bacterium]|jgi:uncharacterized membrane protein YcgQ (UPF0703/DUF1980 family)
MRDKINLSLAITALLIWSTVLIYFYASGRIVHYLDERFRVMALIGGLGLAVVALFNMTRLFSKKASSCCGHDHGDGHDHDHATHDHSHDDHDHDHDHDDNSYVGNVVTFVLMIGPLLVAAKYSGDEYVSAATAKNKAEAAAGSVGFEAFDEMRAQAGSPGETDTPNPDPQSIGGSTPTDSVAGSDATSGQPETQDTPPKTASEWEYTLDDLKKVVDTSDDGNLMLEVDQLFFTNGDAELQRVLDGQAVESLGQIILEEDDKNPDGNRLRVFRFMVTCCAADAQRVSIPIEFDGDFEMPDLENGDYREMSWVKISGIVHYPIEDDRPNAVIKVRKLEKGEKPLDYLMF